MPYTVESLDNLPVPTIVATMLEPYDTTSDQMKCVNEVNSTLGHTEGDPVYVVIDVSGLHMNLGGLMQGLASAFLPQKDVSIEHLNASRVRTVIIGSGSLMKLAVKAAGQDHYGNRRVELFPTLDEALNHILKTAKA